VAASGGIASRAGGGEVGGGEGRRTRGRGIGWIDGSSSSGDGESSATDAMAGPVLLLVLVSVSCVLARQRMEEPGYCLHQTLTFADNVVVNIDLASCTFERTN